MDFKNIQIEDITISDKVFNINKDVDFYSIKYDNDKLKLLHNFTSYSGIKKNAFNKEEINLSIDEDFKNFIRKVESFVENKLDYENLEFKSVLKQYQEYPEFLKVSINKDTIYKKDIDYKNIPINCTITITGVWTNNKNYGISLKLNKISGK